MKSQVLSLLWGISLLVTAPAFGMDQQKEEKSTTVGRKLFKIVSDSDSPLEMISDDLKGVVAKNLSSQDCCLVLMTSKRLHNWLLPHQVPFSLSVELKEIPGSPCLMQTSEMPGLSLKNCKLSLLYSPKDMTRLENPLLLCSFRTPLNFTPECTSYSLSSNAYHPVSYFKFHGAPDTFFLVGVPEDWTNQGRVLKNDLCSVGCNSMQIDLSSLEGKKLNLHLNGTIITPQPPLFSCSLSDLNYAEPHEKQLERLTPVIKMYHSMLNFSLEQIATSYPELTKKEIKEILDIKDETREEVFARLRPEIIQCIDADMSREEIARKFSIPEDLIDEILNSGN